MDDPRRAFEKIFDVTDGPPGKVEPANSLAMEGIEALERERLSQSVVQKALEERILALEESLEFCVAELKQWHGTNPSALEEYEIKGLKLAYERLP